jgi:hypothetical protein
MRYSNALPHRSLVSAAAAWLVASCGDGGTGPGAPVTVGDPVGPDHTGQYHLGPVDFAESEWHNACAPYPSSIRTITGNMIAGVSNSVATPGSLCDACIEVTTAMGRTEVLRVVTYGESGSDGDIDVSPEAYAALNLDEFPRTMTWHLVACDNTEPLYVQFQTEASQWWTSLWVRNPTMAIDRVEVINARFPGGRALERGTDGTFTESSGFGEGPFTLRVVGVTGASVDIAFDGVEAGALVAASGNIPLS